MFRAQETNQGRVSIIAELNVIGYRDCYRINVSVCKKTVTLPCFFIVFLVNIREIPLDFGDTGLH